MESAYQIEPFEHYREVRGPFYTPEDLRARYDAYVWLEGWVDVHGKV